MDYILNIQTIQLIINYVKYKSIRIIWYMFHQNNILNIVPYDFNVGLYTVTAVIYKKQTNIYAKKISFIYN